MHLAARHLQAEGGSIVSPSISSHNITAGEVGSLMISSFIVASSTVRTLRESTLNAMADRIMVDFSRLYADEAATNLALKALGPLVFSVKEMVLAAVVKLMTLAPIVVRLRLSFFGIYS